MSLDSLKVVAALKINTGHNTITGDFHPNHMILTANLTDEEIKVIHD